MTRFLRRHAGAALATIVAGLVCAVTPVRAQQAVTPLLPAEVIASVSERYPPLLAALIEQDIASGRLRQAEGAFDLTLNANLSNAPLGYYDGRAGSVIFEQPLQNWGAKVYGGYRLSSGFLPNYTTQRTPGDGQLTAGVRLSLLRDGRIDKERATRAQARIAEAAVDPAVARARLDFLRAATVAYYQWVASGFRLSAVESLLRVANERDAAIREQVRRGALAPIVQTDNERLVISRRLALTQAQRRFEAHAIELSLFLRDREDRPVVAPRERLPSAFPDLARPESLKVERDIEEAMRKRPEIRSLALSLERLEVDRQLARSDLLPSLDVGVEARQSPGGRRLPDVEATETRLGVEFSVPLQRREATGRLRAVEAQLRQMQTQERFARDRIAAEVRDTHSALIAAAAQREQAARNVSLATTLEDAERLRFRQGAADLFALQIREQATFDARLSELDTHLEYFRALANYRAAVVADPAI